MAVFQVPAKMAGIVAVGMIVVLLPSVHARCPVHGDTICAEDATESMAIGHKLGRTLKEVPNPAGHPMRSLMSAQATCGGGYGGYGDLESYPYPSDPVPPPLTKELYETIQADLKALLNDSKDFFPADFGGKNGGTYIGLFIRLAWHCAGSYRRSDGRGGCEGGRIRFGPEYEWPDNTNLDKALLLLEPIHEKYSEYISWGDLIILSGNVAISSSGGPILGFCGGRVDDPNGSASLPLGPTSVQQSLAECPANFEGDCPKPLAPAEVGLIYVNPGGPKEAPSDPVASADQIRKIFARMGFNEREQVALIGGGHTFGKVHGACPDGPGPGPITSPAAPYPGLCKNKPFVEGVTGRGTGENTFTSGFEGPWTESPTDWDNEYFTNLLAFDWKLEKGPSGAEQWAPYNKKTGERGPEIMMLTSDIAFISDPVYKALVEEYASDIESLSRDFAAAWYKLTTQDMGPASRCTGPDVPAPAPFQVPLPEATVPAGADTSAVEVAIMQLLRKQPHAVPLIANLGYQCSSTFRTTSWVGGCNGGRIRFEPEISFPGNEGASSAIGLLEPIYNQHKDVISFTDLMVLASGLALEKAGGPYVPFCPGRVDAKDGKTERSVAPRDYYLDPLVAARDSIDILGLTASEYVALFARPTKDSPKVSNKVFVDLVSNEWEPVLIGDEVTVDPYTGEYRAKDGSMTIPVSTWVLLKDADLREWVQEFAMYPEKLTAELGSAWVYLMNADRFDGPTGNVCSGPEYQFVPAY